jgi:hypothetical protein
MSSFASCMSEYSGPVTPASGQSPIAEEGFVDVMPYELGQNLHGLPLDQPSRTIQCDQSLYSSWQMVPHTSAFNDGHSTPFPPQLVLPTAGDFTNTHMGEHNSLDTGMMPTMDPSWTHFSSVANPNMAQHWGSRELDHVIPEGSLQGLWAGHMQTSHEAMETIMPSVAMVDTDDAYVQIGSESFTGSDPFTNTIPYFSQSPQEVSFKKENSPLLKQESDSEDTPLLTRSIYVSPTGGKTVKKEHQTRVAKKRSKRTRHNKGLSEHDRKKVSKLLDDEDDKDDEGRFLNRVKLIQEDIFLYKDEETGRLNYCTTKVPCEKKRCEHRDERGVRCTSVFKRPEHLKRHERTHNPDRDYPCRICCRKFNRHDNLQAHIVTHLRLPGKKDGRNSKLSLAELEAFCSDPITGPKLIEKLHQKWKSEGGDLCMADVIA